jgi:hypothetical protein
MCAEGLYECVDHDDIRLVCSILHCPSSSSHYGTHICVVSCTWGTARVRPWRVIDVNPTTVHREVTIGGRVLSRRKLVVGPNTVRPAPADNSLRNALYPSM